MLESPFEGMGDLGTDIFLDEDAVGLHISDNQRMAFFTVEKDIDAVVV